MMDFYGKNNEKNNPKLNKNINRSSFLRLKYFMTSFNHKSFLKIKRTQF